jgi:hypothetical protein
VKLVASHCLAIIVAASYLTLGVAQPAAARNVWWAYGLISFALAVVNYSLTRNGHDRTPRRR